MINIWLVILGAVTSMVVGYVWYGPLFGKKWLQVIGANAQDLAEREKMQAAAKPLYLIQFLLALFQVWVLGYFIYFWQESSSVLFSLLVWAGFIVPVLAGSAMWNNDSAKISWTRFLLQAGYQLVVFILLGFIFYWWG